MDFEEHAAKRLLAAHGVAVPEGALVVSADGAASAARRLAPCVVKAQVPAGGRGKAGGVRMAATADEARAAAAEILEMEIAGHAVERLLVERRVGAASEVYAAVLNDPAARRPLLLFSNVGGVDIEEAAASRPDTLVRVPVDIRHGVSPDAIEAAVARGGAGDAAPVLAGVLAKLYGLYAASDAELVEVNPLAMTDAGGAVALDCKFVLDESAAARRPEIAALGAPEPLTPRETRARGHGLSYIELDGTVGVLANGAGLTMTTLDAVRHYGGRPANFLEIGGEAYRLAAPAVELVLSDPRVRSLVVNFCGAFARTDVMTLGVVEAWRALRPTIPVFFSIHGTGEDEAVAMVRDQLGLEPFDVMDDAVRAAVRAAQ